MSVVLASPPFAHAQQAPTVTAYRVGVIDFREEKIAAVFRTQLTSALQREFTSIGKNVVLAYEVAPLPRTDFSAVIRKILEQKPDALYATTTAIARQARQLAPDLPIVFSGAIDPVATGLISHMDRPGGNFTGFTSYTDTAEARWEVLRDAFKGLRVIAVITDPDRFTPDNFARLAQRATSSGLQLLLLPMSPDLPDDAIAAAIMSARVDAFDILSSTLLRQRHRTLIAAVNRRGVPAIFPHEDYVERGGLMSYSHVEPDFAAVAASYLRRIASGVPAGSIPVAVPTQFRLAINISTAKSFPQPISPSFLKRADLFFR